MSTQLTEAIFACTALALLLLGYVTGQQQSLWVVVGATCAGLLARYRPTPAAETTACVAGVAAPDPRRALRRARAHLDARLCQPTASRVPEPMTARADFIRFLGHDAPYTDRYTIPRAPPSGA